MNMPGHMARQFVSSLLRGGFRIHPHDIFCAAGPDKSAPCAQNNPLSCLPSMNTCQRSPEDLLSTPGRPSLQTSSAWPCKLIRNGVLGKAQARLLGASFKLVTIQSAAWAALMTGTLTYV